MKPKLLTDLNNRRYARELRDTHWEFMERIEKLGMLWWCIWNKNGKEEALDEVRCSLIRGLEINSWIQRHRNWFRVGRWSEERYAQPVRLTRRGEWALHHRKRYDLEPVEGGLVEPGWIAYPSASHPDRRSAAESV